MNYVLITPVKNEQKYIQQTIDSVVKQTVLPLVWVIIDGGSTDKTRDIVQENAKKYPWIVVRHQLRFGTTSHMSVSIAMKEAYDYIRASGLPFEYVWTIDGDTVLEPNVCEGVITSMEKPFDISISAASGQVYNPDGTPDTYPEGELPNKRVYRRTVFDFFVSGFPITKYSFDSVILAKLRINNWGIKTFPEYKIQNLRKDMGIEHTSTIKSNIQWGHSRYYLGYSFPLLAMGCGYLVLKGEFSKSIGIFCGWMDSWINRDEVIDDQEVWNHFHYQRLSEIMNTIHINPHQAVILCFMFDAIVIGVGVWWYLCNH